MKKHRFILSFLMFIFFSEAIFAQEEGTPGYFKTVNKAIQQFMQKKKVPGVSVALFVEDKPYAISYGVANVKDNIPVYPATIFELASVTKVFTAILVAENILDGQMALTDPVTKFMPWFYEPDIPFNRISIVNLATHTSSLPRALPAIKEAYTPGSVMLFLTNWKPSYPIASKYSYSNLGFGILGYALEGLNRKSYSQLLYDGILEPLAMNSTELVVPDSLKPFYATGYSKEGKPVPYDPVGALPASGALRSSGLDMLKFLQANLGVRGSKELIKAIRYTQEPYFKVNADLSIGLAWQRTMTGGMLILDKNGGYAGFSSYIGIIPDKKIGVVLLANKGKTGITKLGRSILRNLAIETSTINQSLLPQAK